MVTLSPSASLVAMPSRKRTSSSLRRVHRSGAATVLDDAPADARVPGVEVVKSSSSVARCPHGLLASV